MKCNRGLEFVTPIDMACYHRWSDQMLELMMKITPFDLLQASDKDPKGRFPPLFSLALTGNSKNLKLLLKRVKYTQAQLQASTVYVRGPLNVPNWNCHG